MQNSLNNPRPSSSRTGPPVKPAIAAVLTRLQDIFRQAAAPLRVTATRSLDEARGHYLLAVSGSAGASHRIFLRIAASGEPRQVDIAHAAYQRYRRTTPECERPAAALLAAPDISDLARRRCDEQGLNYLDTANNSYHISLTPYYLERIGPVPTTFRKRKLGPLFSQPRIQAIRVLLCFPHREWHQKDLAAEAHLSTGTVNALVRRLEEEGYLLRDGKGPRQRSRLIRPGELLDAWAQHWRTVQRLRHRYYARFPSPDSLMQALVRAARRVSGLPRPLTPEGPYPPAPKLPYVTSPPLAFTGLSAAHLVTPHVLFELVEAYTTLDPILIAQQARLHSVEDGANLVLLEPPDRTAFYQAGPRKRMPCVCLPQLYVDLVAAGGRASSEAAPELRPHILDPQLSFGGELPA